METQNYPIWSGERLRHDPTLTVFYESYEVEEEEEEDGAGVIFGYNSILFIGALGIITVVIVLEKRKRINI